MSEIAILQQLGRGAPSLRFNLPDAIAVRERVCQGTGPNDGLTLDRDRERPRYDSICGRTLGLEGMQWACALALLYYARDVARWLCRIVANARS